jgi:hypothetical protein
MSQAASSWSKRPTTKKPPSQVAGLDSFVTGRSQETARLNVEIPKALRARVKSRCALEGKDIRDVVTELLEQRFPE